MSKPPKERKPIEIVVSTYWPTKIVKSVNINDPNESYGHTITLAAADAKYVYERLEELYGDAA